MLAEGSAAHPHDGDPIPDSVASPLDSSPSSAAGSLSAPLRLICFRGGLFATSLRLSRDPPQALAGLSHRAPQAPQRRGLAPSRSSCAHPGPCRGAEGHLQLVADRATSVGSTSVSSQLRRPPPSKSTIAHHHRRLKRVGQVVERVGRHRCPGVGEALRCCIWSTRGRTSRTRAAAAGVPSRRPLQREPTKAIFQPLVERRIGGARRAVRIRTPRRLEGQHAPPLEIGCCRAGRRAWRRSSASTLCSGRPDSIRSVTSSTSGVAAVGQAECTRIRSPGLRLSSACGRAGARRGRRPVRPTLCQPAGRQAARA